MIAALFVQKNGSYFDLDGVDPWDVERDARTYAGPWPVVAHPPCARWCRLAALVEATYPHLKRGADDGCFAAALAAVRKFGGVLEHPAFSDAWSAHGLTAPGMAGWCRDDTGGWSCYVEQHRYGHRARKATWLYAFNVRELPSLRWGRTPDSELGDVKWGTPGHRGVSRPRLRTREASKTPTEFRDVLLSIARSAAAVDVEASAIAEAS